MKSLTLTGALCTLVIAFACAQTSIPARPDCQDAYPITASGTYHVNNPDGPGQNPFELDGADCFFNGVPLQVESHSAWLRLTCPSKGTLTFVITPDVAADDIDFALFKSSSGNCSAPELVRCMAAGDNMYPSACMGPTGLLPGETDLFASAGCALGGNNFLAPVEVQAGETLLLCVNNFSAQHGFNIAFNPGSLLQTKAGLQGAVLELSPNPVADVLRLQMKESVPIDSLEIVDMQGRVVQREFNTLAAGEVNVRSLPAGTYWLRATSGGQSWGGKFEKAQ